MSRVRAANLTLDIRRPKHERLAPRPRTPDVSSPTSPTGHVRMVAARSPPLVLRGSSLMGLRIVVDHLVL